MGTSWTKEQRQVIDARNRNILVSAAAGSGKTAVLVERIISRILDKENPIDIDKMLIVTFTNAAAGEMRERISQAIEDALEEDYENSHLQKQASLVHHANIMTIHSFCMTLIRNHFHQIDLEPNFRIAEEAELSLVKEDVLAEVLEQEYANRSKAFLRLVESFASGKTDLPLKEMIFQLYEYSMSYPWPVLWLESQTEHYRVNCVEELLEKDFMQQINAAVEMVLKDVLEVALKNIRLAEMEDGPVQYLECAKSDYEQIVYLLKSKNYVEYESAFRTLSFVRLSTKKQNCSEEKKEHFKENRNRYIKAPLQKLQETFFFAPPNIMYQRMRDMLPVMEELIRVTLEFHQLYEQRKRELNVVDFGDLEHFALKVLYKEGTNETTDAAKEYQKMFEEVMVDEYQDSNLVQDFLLHAVSKEEQGIYNQFMVGDVKQSIYRFRLARPEIFMDKYHTYETEQPGENKNISCQKIELHKNFRSRKTVLDFTNDIFYKIMQSDLGNVEYDEDAALYAGAEFVEVSGDEPYNFDTEVWLSDLECEELEEIGITDKYELEANMIASRIRTLMKTQKVTDKKTGELRYVKCSDIVILMRSLTENASVLTEVLDQKGIPSHMISKSGYFQTLEIQTILNLLKVLDNPLQDIPLISILKNMIGRFTEEELSKIRIYGKGTYFYQCFFGEKEEGIDAALHEKIEHTREQISKYRDLVTELPIHELLQYLLEDTGYLDYVTALPGGMQRRANVYMLLEQAMTYETTSYQGLFHFIRYIDKIQMYDIDYGEAEITGENDNAVRLMTIHKSKGLEFPIVIVAGMGKKFNTRDQRGNMVLHPEIGVGLSYIEAEKRQKATTLLKKLITYQSSLENLGEELRVLYVAFTRAKEKLIITGVVKGMEDLLEKTEQIVDTSQKALPFSLKSSAGCYLDWLLPALVSLSYKYPIYQMGAADFVTEEIEHQMGEEQAIQALFAGNDLSEETRKRAKEYVRQQLSYGYPYVSETDRKVKYSVSELKHRAMDAWIAKEDEGIENLSFQEQKEEKEKRFHPSEGALRGSATHRAMECFDLARLVDAGWEEMDVLLQEEKKRLMDEGRMDTESANLLIMDKIKHFYGTSLAKRMKQALEREELFLEKPFVMGRPASEIEAEDDSDTMILIQGIIDAFFIEDDEIVLLDYKTDVVKNSGELREKYKKQLELYATALEANFNKRVKEKILYSFYLEEEIFV